MILKKKKKERKKKRKRKKEKKEKKGAKTASSVSSTHPAIEISTPQDYHHFSQLHPPSWIRPRRWRHTSSIFSFPWVYPFRLSLLWVDGFRLLLMMFPVPTPLLLCFA